MDFITKLITKSPVFVFSKSYCPYCSRVKNALNSVNVKFESVELNKIDNGEIIQDMLKQLTGRSTVPNVFINGISIGGCIINNII